MAWYDIIFVVQEPGPTEQKEIGNVYFVHMIPIPGHAIGHFIGDKNLVEYTAWSARVHDSKKFSEAVKDLEDEFGSRLVYISIGI